MAEKDPLMNLIVEGAINRSLMEHPQHFAAWLSGVMANVVAALPDEYFKEMMKVERCDTLGCDCHEALETMMGALDVQRDAHRRILPLAITE